MAFARWLRQNAEHYLVCDAQDKLARKMGFNPPNRPKGLGDRFWRQVFVPIYRMLPWGIRDSVMKSLPGSHRQSWPRKNFRTPGSE